MASPLFLETASGFPQQTLLPAISPSPLRKQRLREPGAVDLLHPLFLEADEALVNHIHRQILIGQSSFHLVQDGRAHWEEGRGRVTGGVSMTGGVSAAGGVSAQWEV